MTFDLYQFLHANSFFFFKQFLYKFRFKCNVYLNIHSKYLLFYYISNLY